MNNSWQIKGSALSGSIKIPPSKSYTMRAILTASLAKGESLIHNILLSPDTKKMIIACRSFGARIEQQENFLKINGVNGKPKFNQREINCGNSGLVYRFITLIAALDQQWITIDGDDSIRNLRPIKPLLQVLTGMGAEVEFLGAENQAPFRIKGRLEPKDCNISSEDSQPISALFWLAICNYSIKINFTNCLESKWLDFSASWLKRFNVILNKTPNSIELKGKIISGFKYTVPSDMSTSLFTIVAGSLHGRIKLDNFIFDFSQPDAIALEYLIKNGLVFKENTIYKSAVKGGSLDVSQCIDALPMLMFHALFATSCSTFYNYHAACNKESNRVISCINNLDRLGIRIELDSEKIVVFPQTIIGGVNLLSYNDHRIALALAVIASKTFKPIVIENIDCVAKTWSTFKHDWNKIGLNIHDR